MGNVKNAPEGRYFKELGYSQCYPWVVVDESASGKTLTLKQVNTLPDPEWKPVMYAGGFAGHCVNQQEQTWLYGGVSELTKTVRLTKKGWSYKGTKFVESDGPSYFYDYNF